MNRHRPKVITDRDLAGLHPRFKWVWDYLAHAAPPGRLPGRQHIDPATVKDMLPLVNIVELIGEGEAMRFRF